MTVQTPANPETPELPPSAPKKRFGGFFYFCVALLTIAAIALWASDTVTLQGERTAYSALCDGHVWEQGACTGTITAGPRYRYRALKLRHEVLFWIANSPEPSGKLTNCLIEDGRNWSCPTSPDMSRSIVSGISGGEPVSEPGVTLPFHHISKLQWILLSMGITVFAGS